MRAYSWKSLYLNGIHFIGYQFSHTHKKRGFLMSYSPIFAEGECHGSRSGKCLKKSNSYITSNLSWSLCCLEWNGVNPKIIARCSCLFPRCFIHFLCWKEKNKTVIFPLQFLKCSPMTVIINVLSYWACLFQESSVPSPRFWSSSTALQLVFYSP